MDPTGNAYEDPFYSADDAAIDFANLYYDDTQRNSTEYGSYIYKINVKEEYGDKNRTIKINNKEYKIEDGKMLIEKKNVDDEGDIKTEEVWVEDYYTYAKPKRGAKDTNDVILGKPDERYELVGSIHTHTIKGYSDFSHGDIESHNSLKVTSYLVNYQKELIKWPWGEKPNVIYEIDESNIDYSNNPYSEDMWINPILNLF